MSRRLLSFREPSGPLSRVGVNGCTTFGTIPSEGKHGDQEQRRPFDRLTVLGAGVLGGQIANQ